MSEPVDLPEPGETQENAGIEDLSEQEKVDDASTGVKPSIPEPEKQTSMPIPISSLDDHPGLDTLDVSSPTAASAINVLPIPVPTLQKQDEVITGPQMPEPTHSPDDENIASMEVAPSMPQAEHQTSIPMPISPQDDHGSAYALFVDSISPISMPMPTLGHSETQKEATSLHMPMSMPSHPPLAEHHEDVGRETGVSMGGAPSMPEPEHRMSMPMPMPGGYQDTSNSAHQYSPPLLINPYDPHLQTPEFSGPTAVTLTSNSRLDNERPSTFDGGPPIPSLPLPSPSHAHTLTTSPILATPTAQLATDPGHIRPGSSSYKPNVNANANHQVPVQAHASPVLGGGHTSGVPAKTSTTTLSGSVEAHKPTTSVPQPMKKSNTTVLFKPPEVKPLNTKTKIKMNTTTNNITIGHTNSTTHLGSPGTVPVVAKPSVAPSSSSGDATPSETGFLAALAGTTKHSALDPSHKPKPSSGPNANDASPPERPHLIHSTPSQMDTQYVNMLLALDDIPAVYNLAASFFNWILLAGFILFPGTFTNLQTLNAANGGVVPAGLVNSVTQIPLFVIAWICCGIGGAGMIWLWYRWRLNYLWALDKIFAPGLLNSLAGLLSTLASIYGAQNGQLSATSKVTLIVTGACSGVFLVLTGIYSLWVVKRVKRKHDRQVGKQRVGKHGEGVADLSKRKLKSGV